MDAEWWKYHLERVKRDFPGRRLSFMQRPGVEVIAAPYFKHCAGKGQNSGAGAIAVAAALGARRVILLGYDCKYAADGRRHWHGDHEKGTGAGNAGTIGRWPGQFTELVKYLRGTTVINASRETALTAFPRMPLEEALA